MPFVGLVHARDWEPPELPDPPPRPSWNVPWRAIVLVAGWWAMLAFVPPAVDDAFGGLAGYLALLGVIGLGFWRFERFCARLYWRGLRDFKL